MKNYQCTSKEEEAFLSSYDASKYERPSVTTDIVIFTLDEDDDLNILLIKRGSYPYKDRWAIPGGFLDVGKESLDEAAARELKEETNVEGVFLNQLYTFGDPNRDPRTPVVTVAYMALVPKQALNISAGDDANDARLFKITYDVNGIILKSNDIIVDESALAFDHADIIKLAINRLRNRIDYTDDAFNLLKDKNCFAISELKKIYEAIKNKSFNLSNFHTMFLREYVKSGKAVELEQTRVTKGKPTRLYKYIGR